MTGYLKMLGTVILDGIIALSPVKPPEVSPKLVPLPLRSNRRLR